MMVSYAKNSAQSSAKSYAFEHVGESGDAGKLLVTMSKHRKRSLILSANSNFPGCVIDEVRRGHELMHISKAGPFGYKTYYFKRHRTGEKFTKSCK